jgi:hypothetical protein
MRNLNEFTELELTVIKALSFGDDFEEMPTQCFEDIIDETGFSKNKLKGVLGSLEKKDAYIEGEYPNGMTAYHLPNEINELL